MQKNIGTTDRLLRFSIGLIFLVFAWWQYSFILLAVAVFCFYEAAMGWCAFYQLIGKNSCSLEK